MKMYKYFSIPIQKVQVYSVNIPNENVQVYLDPKPKQFRYSN